MKIVVNILGLKLGWWACVLGAIYGFWWIGPIVVGIHLAAHLALTADLRRETVFLVYAAVLGLILDSTLSWFSILSYREPLGVGWLSPIWRAGQPDWGVGPARFGGVAGRVAGGPAAHQIGLRPPLTGHRFLFTLHACRRVRTARVGFWHTVWRAQRNTRGTLGAKDAFAGGAARHAHPRLTLR